ncbi:hypothetical protein VN12_19650 [Pirellula sp. SH-Sr6A]|uniref:hypothetical protein n=1 Tax=Pirellula sp. SH-Sr6A TaxID=1632865 RepID=UPI00078C54D1|nr:hypothetical protein [Pirellula sp. SH-Sr6A]AMV30890.1 hypothetical protein VN12_02160 [Pirellula sp. SH-Sr6A]AMV31310.1 hypothetical protein VN12_04280 [Pirellula sp. SH-Sr6A]AMV34350.1 hypothetical protein VN12_19650 [Pirellula sp. SH-Sr6A]
MSHTPRIETRVVEEFDLYWVYSSVNGWCTQWPVQSPTKEDGEVLAAQLRNLIRSVYRQAYNDGIAACQEQIKNALGVK